MRQLVIYLLKLGRRKEYLNREDVIKVLAYLKVAYPNFYKNMTREEAEETINLYQEMFADSDFKIVSVIVKEWIQTEKFPPTIADIKQKIYSLTTQEILPTDLWASLKKAISNSAYHSVEEFEKLPAECKMFVKNPSQLRELSQNDSEINNTVVKGQFFKQVEIIQKRIKEEKQMLPETRRIREMALSVGQDVNLLSE